MVWLSLLDHKELPLTPQPDADQMWGYYKHGGTDEQALLDQACECLGGMQMRLSSEEWKLKTHTLTRKLDRECRYDEARMWLVIHSRRFPKEGDPFYNHGVLISQMCDRAKFGGAPKSHLIEPNGTKKLVPTDQYCAFFSKAAQSYYRHCLKLEPKHRAAYINQIGSLERNEPFGWYDQVHHLAAEAVRNGIWYNQWQRPPHFVPSLAAAAWHRQEDYPLCLALRQHFHVIRGEYDQYVGKLASRKDWDDSDNTPGLSDVGNREGALHDGGLAKSGRWREVPLFTNSAAQHEYLDYFPQTAKILQDQGDPEWGQQDAKTDAQHTHIWRFIFCWLNSFSK